MIAKPCASPWQFACDWYTVEDIERHIARVNSPGLMPAADKAIPTDVRSREFAEWLTHQYRLAMTKGIEIGRRQAFDGAVSGMSTGDMPPEVLMVAREIAKVARASIRAIVVEECPGIDDATADDFVTAVCYLIGEQDAKATK